MSDIIKPPLGSQLIPGHPINDGLVGRWLFNENSGDHTYDLVDTRDIICVGTDWSVSEQGHVLDFESTENDYAYGSSNRLTGLTAQTVSMWINIESITDYHGLIAVWSGSSSTRAWATIIDSAGKLGYYINGDPASTFSKWTTNPAITTGQWYHVVCTWVPSTSMTFYLNGVLLEQFTSTIPPTMMASTVPLTFGCWGNSSEDLSDRVYSLDGKINNVSLYNRTLTSTEIAELYQNPYPGIDTGEIPIELITGALGPAAVSNYPYYYQQLLRRRYA